MQSPEKLYLFKKMRTQVPLKSVRDPIVVAILRFLKVGYCRNVNCFAFWGGGGIVQNVK
jgi:hypothetical protein